MNNLSKYQPQFLGLLRIVAALTYMEHGTQKLFQFPPRAAEAAAQGGGGGGGMPPLFLTGGIIELVGGILLALGLFTRPVAFIVSGELAYIYWTMHFPRGGFWPVYNGGEAAILWCFTFLYLVFSGPGAFALDNLLFKRRAAVAV